MDQLLITRIVEAALLAASQPLTVVQLQALFLLDEPAPQGGVAKALETLQADCAQRGIELVEVASGWRYQVRADVHPWVARLWTERQTRYTRATLETLALIAYRQPITRGEIEQVRGVAVNSNIIKALEEREWIRVVGHRDIPGRPELLGTTKGFLDYFGLKRLDELPPLSELKDFGELDPQFAFDGKPDPDMPVGDVAVDHDDTPAPFPVDPEMPARPEPVEGRTRDPDADADAMDTPVDPSARPSTSSAPASDSIGGRADAEADTTPDSPTNTAQDETNEHALADDGDSTGARHE